MLNVLSLKETAQTVEDLQSKARGVLDRLIPNDAHIILLDYPHHPNVGDSLIWLGEISYLKSRGLKPSYVSDYKNYNSETIKKILNKNSVILLHGGGNFGNLWKHLHAFKLQVLKDFSTTPMIQLPQTIYFEGDDGLADTADIINKHNNFTLLVRCHHSFAFAQLHFRCSTILCPDMAFFIGPIINNKSPVVDRFVLSRTDAEKSSALSIILIQADNKTSVQIEDWLTISKQEYQIERVESHHLFRKLFNKLDRNNQVLLLMWNLLAKYRLKRGVAQLCTGSVVVTDRLHAHILCILMNKPHVLIDNSYGKLSHFYETWTSNWVPAILVKDVQTLKKVASELAASLSQHQADHLSHSQSATPII